MISARRFDAPIMLVGFTALSVEISINFFCTVVNGTPAHIQSPEYIVLHRFGRGLLSISGMLVGCRLEHDSRPVTLKHVFQPFPVPAGTDDYFKIQFILVFEYQFVLQIVCIILISNMISFSGRTWRSGGRVPILLSRLRRLP